MPWQGTRERNSVLLSYQHAGVSEGGCRHLATQAEWLGGCQFYPLICVQRIEKGFERLNDKCLGFWV